MTEIYLTKRVTDLVSSIFCVIGLQLTIDWTNWLINRKKVTNLIFKAKRQFNKRGLLKLLLSTATVSKSRFVFLLKLLNFFNEA
jgi:hypothetical protein